MSTPTTTVAITTHPTRPTSIGYYNPNSYPISFTSMIGGRAAHEVGAGQPVLRKDNSLAVYDDDLEAQVKLGLLRHIVPGDANYKRLKDEHARLGRQEGIRTVPAAEITLKDLKPASKSQDLPEGAEMRGSEIWYKDKPFASLSALHAFMDHSEEA